MIPEGRVDGVIAMGTGAITIERLVDFVWAGLSESATATVKFAVPVALGIPVISPVDVFRLSPAGMFPDTSDQLYGAVPPLACSDVE